MGETNIMQGKTVVLGITGGIAAYKSCELVSRLKKAGADVWCVMTPNATQFITPLTLENLSGHAVATQVFSRETPYDIEHIALARRADVFVIAPATANLLAKAAAGIADDLLTTTLLATRAPVLVAPAMNTAMWEHPATVQNMQVLRARGVYFCGPATGRLACGDEGPGRMAEAAEIFEAIAAILATDAPGAQVLPSEQGNATKTLASARGPAFAPAQGAVFADTFVPESSLLGTKNLAPNQDLSGKTVLVTAGPTLERLDPVRYLSNHSTGLMGYCLAQAAQQRGASVILVSGPSALLCPPGVTLVLVETAQQMYDAVLQHLPSCHAIIKAAAPADYRPAQTADQKLKKSSEGISLSLVPNPDIAAAVGARKGARVLVVFAAETNDGIPNAKAKLERKNADLAVLNDVTQPGAGFGSPTNIVTLIDKTGQSTPLPQMPKTEVAHAILDRISPMVADVVLEQDALPSDAVPPQ